MVKVLRCCSRMRASGNALACGDSRTVRCERRTSAITGSQARVLGATNWLLGSKATFRPDGAETDALNHGITPAAAESDTQPNSLRQKGVMHRPHQGEKVKVRGTVRPPKPSTLTHSNQNGAFSDDVKVAVVIPTYNEAENLPAITDQLYGLDVAELGVIIVDDGSPDGTGEIADQLVETNPGRFIVVHRTGKLGLGTAYVKGFEVALTTSVESIVQMDCDLSHPASEVPKMVDALLHSDLVVGTRYGDEGGVDPEWSLGRVLLSKWSNVGIRFILGLRVRDVTSGFKAYRRETLQRLSTIDYRLTGFGFQAEVAYHVQRSGLRVTEHPYTFMERIAGESKMSLGIAAEALWRLTLLRIRG